LRASSPYIALDMRRGKAPALIALPQANKNNSKKSAPQGFHPEDVRRRLARVKKKDEEHVRCHQDRR
jgi:hypothetical protein